jgi:uncharacterized damage-inducible protein DinB
MPPAVNVAYISTLFEYDRWANARTLEATAKLMPEQFTRDMGSSMRSVRDTMVHILSAEGVWLTRWSGGMPKGHLDAATFPNLESLRAEWAGMEREMGALLASLTDERLQSVFAYSTFAGQPQAQPLWQQIVHLANHSTYHRGQITTMLRQLGAEPVGTDLITFFREQPSPR